MQVLAPLLDASGRPGTVGQLLSSNGSVAAPGWRPAPAATDGLRVSLAAGTPYAAGDQLAKAVLYLSPTAGGQAGACD